MKLKVLDQLHVSSVQADTLRPGQIITVSDALGQELLDKHFGKFERARGTKAKPAPENKADAPAENKS